jgi:hypothetical protein
MTDPTHDVDSGDMAPFDPAAEAASSMVGPRTDDAPEPLAGTDAMGSETGGLAGTSR